MDVEFVDFFCEFIECLYWVELRSINASLEIICKNSAPSQGCNEGFHGIMTTIIW